MSHPCLDCQTTIVRNRSKRCNPCAYKHRQREGSARYEARNNKMRVIKSKLHDPVYVASCWERWAIHGHQGI